MRKGHIPAWCRRATLVVCGGLCVGALIVVLGRRASSVGGHDPDAGVEGKG